MVLRPGSCSGCSRRNGAFNGVRSEEAETKGDGGTEVRQRRGRGKEEEEKKKRARA